MTLIKQLNLKRLISLPHLTRFMTRGNFTEPLTRADALHLSTTVFTSVGFGDISAVSEAARLLVTLQMILDLLLLGW